MKRNAIILAAGASKRFAPFTYEKPKGLFCVRGEILIERQIEQLREAGVEDIYVVIGFMKEKFFYLEEKYGVKLVINNSFADKGNLYSLYKTRKFMKNTYICCADHYFTENPFQEETTYSYRACIRSEEKLREFTVDVSDCDVITGFHVGEAREICMVGHAFFNENFSRKFVELMEEEIEDFGISKLFWEEFYARHQKELTLYVKYYETDKIQEFESVNDLREFDNGFLDNIDSTIVKNICNVLQCKPNDIKKIDVIQRGLTNVSFSFTVDGKQYVYRHPGGTASKLVDRESEYWTQYKAFELGLDKSLIYMDKSGWKISYYVQNLVESNLTDEYQLEKAMEYLRKLHCVKVTGNIKNFDTFLEAEKLMKIASFSKGNLMEEFAELYNKMQKLDVYLKADGVTTRVLCHNDTYAPNYLVTEKGEMYLIDWEYAGINDPANDIGCILCRDNYTDEEIEHYLKVYFGRKLTENEHRHYIAYIALSGFYWFCWGLYKGSVNDDDGFFFLPAYRSCRRFADRALKMYMVEE